MKKNIFSIEQLKSKRLELLKEEIELVQIEELLQIKGEHEEALCVKAERNELYLERKTLERRMKFFLIEGESA